MSIREKVIEQINLMEIIREKANINIVNCGNCGDVFLHEIHEGDIECPYCDFKSDQCDFPDFLYKGMENSEAFDEPNKIEWKCTDTDNQQYGRQLSETKFEFKEKNRGLTEYEEDEYIQIEVDLKDYSDKEVNEHISPYYRSLIELYAIYGEDSNWIIAECIFEQESGLY